MLSRPIRHVGAENGDIFGEPNMRGGELVDAMVAAMDHLVNARKSSASRFNGRYVTRYLEAYKA